MPPYIIVANFARCIIWCYKKIAPPPPPEVPEQFETHSERAARLGSIAIANTSWHAECVWDVSDLDLSDDAELFCLPVLKHWDRLGLLTHGLILRALEGYVDYYERLGYFNVQNSNLPSRIPAEQDIILV